MAKVEHIDFPPGRRVLVVSDIHGNLPLLKGLLDKVGFCRDDILINLGDMMERSEGSLETLRYVMELHKNYTVYTICGNCDNLTLEFLDGGPELRVDFFRGWFARHGERCAVVKMAHMAGARVDSPQDYPAAGRAIEERFAPELDFLRGLPHILLHDSYLFVHGGVPREDALEELTAFDVMKNDDFRSQGRRFRRWVVVGHWPVTLYRADIPSAAPIIDRDSHIISIDGGCTLKADGQLNALILPESPGDGFFWTAYDGFPVMTARDDQAPSEDPVNIRWGRSALELLEEGPELCRCRHLESGRELEILTEYLRRDERGVWCEDSTDYRLSVEAGDRLSVVRRLSDRALCKKDGVTGWYFGRLERG